ncbi:MAG: tRNA uridine-5-carboxymethylaminomethyl(34) synthesis GTPase MnmE, partial [Kiritimatiellia bacterium]|nr:tRNA uridine-5-carboxymethylaminomethyl(34) synthesis GTPase MnmE [Kiritimatiellia bacterium]
MSDTDTIVAPATAPQGSLSVIRISGPDSYLVCDKIFSCGGKPPSLRPSHTVVHGKAKSADGKVVDEALLLIMRAPKSYTGENVAEIQCHGGPVVTRRLLGACLDAGCRMAEPGEFTRRAFLNGRMDLLQAEAVQDLVRAETDRAALAALDQLEGSLSRTVNQIHERLVTALAGAESVLDFPDDEMPPIPWNSIQKEVRSAEKEIQALLQGWQEGRILREGIRVVLLGAPNVGKSSLFNRLLDKNRAIVSKTPGTTRDSLEESLAIRGYHIRLTDTAGIRESDCEIEQEGVRRSREHEYCADLVVHVIDATNIKRDSLTGWPGRSGRGNEIWVLNKCDLLDVPTRESIGRLMSEPRKDGRDQVVAEATKGRCRRIFTSAITGEGLDELRDALLETSLDRTSSTW